MTQRIVVTEQVAFHPSGNHPVVALSTSSGGHVNAPAQPYERWFQVGDTWEQVDTGWLKESVVMHVANESGNDTWVIPTEEERAELAKCIIEVAVKSGVGLASFALLPPGHSFRAIVPEGAVYFVRCIHSGNRCRAVVNVFGR